MSKKILVKNISDVDDKYFEVFSEYVSKLDKKIKDLLLIAKYKIILANKCSDVFSSEQLKKMLSESSEYKENYTIDTFDDIYRGICSDIIKAVCVFSNNVNYECLAFVLYHEVGHFVDFYNQTGKLDKSFLSSKSEFVSAYKKDIIENWDEIKKDTRFRLIHCVQNSTPEHASELAMYETFACCFAKYMSAVDEIDFIGLYFKNSYQVSIKLINEFIENF